MAQAVTTSLIDEIVEFLASSPTPQAIIDFKLSDALEERALDLAAINGRRMLTPEERAEMDEFLRMDHLITMLKLKTSIENALL